MTTHYSVTRPIAAPPERVWELLTDADTWTEWNPTVISIAGPIEVGHRVHLRVHLNPKRTFKLKVLEMTAPRRMVWADGMPLGLFTGTRTYTVDPSDGGSTFTMREDYTGPLAGLITRSIPDMNDAFAEFADGLKAAAAS